MTHVKNQTLSSLALGPATIAEIGDAVERLLPWLAQSRYQVLPNGNLRFSDPEPAEAIKLLREQVEAVLPDDLRRRIGERSGLGWNVFFGHVVTWWLPQRGHIGFLRALVDRASLHGVTLELHWNAGRTVPVRRVRPGNEALVWGGGFGVLGGVAVTQLWPGDPILALLCIGAGVVAGRVGQRVVSRRVCGDPLCRAPLGRAATCPSCGGTAEDRE